jgi:hypothetical protein
MSWKSIAGYSSSSETELLTNHDLPITDPVEDVQIMGGQYSWTNSPDDKPDGADHASPSPKQTRKRHETPYRCMWRGCAKKYATLKNLNKHIKAKDHGNNITNDQYSAKFMHDEHMGESRNVSWHAII